MWDVKVVSRVAKRFAVRWDASGRNRSELKTLMAFEDFDVFVNLSIKGVEYGLLG